MGSSVRGVTPLGSDYVPESLDPESDAISIRFTAATRSYRVVYKGETVEVVTKPITYTTDIGYDIEEYRDDANLVFRTGFSRQQNYVGFLLWRSAIDGATQLGAVRRERRLVFGARTVQSDLPTSGITTYLTTFVTPALFNPTTPEYGSRTSGTGTISINWATRAVTATLEFTREPFGNTGSGNVISFPVSFAGTIDAFGRITSASTDPASAEPTLFQGAVYGPHALEIGIMLLRSSAGVGVGLGRQ